MEIEVKRGEVLNIFSLLQIAAKKISEKSEVYLMKGKGLDQKNSYFLAKNNSLLKSISEEITDTSNNITAVFRQKLIDHEILDEKGNILDSRKWAELRKEHDSAFRDRDEYFNQTIKITVHGIPEKEVQFSGEFYTGLFPLFEV